MYKETESSFEVLISISTLKNNKNLTHLIFTHKTVNKAQTPVGPLQSLAAHFGFFKLHSSNNLTKRKQGLVLFETFQIKYRISCELRNWRPRVNSGRCICRSGSTSTTDYELVLDKYE